MLQCSVHQTRKVCIRVAIGQAPRSRAIDPIRRIFFLILSLFLSHTLPLWKHEHTLVETRTDKRMNKRTIE